MEKNKTDGSKFPDESAYVESMDREVDLKMEIRAIKGRLKDLKRPGGTKLNKFYRTKEIKKLEKRLPVLEALLPQVKKERELLFEDYDARFQKWTSGQDKKL